MEFFQTVMGHRFYEATMPALVEQLKRLNDNLEKLVAREVRKDASDQAFLAMLQKNFGSEEEDLSGHDMDRCSKHGAYGCPDCHPLPEDAEER